MNCGCVQGGSHAECKPEIGVVEDGDEKPRPEEADHRAIQAAGRAQVAILVAPDTGGLPLADYALQVAQGWKLGHAGKDDGLLILVVPSQSAARIGRTSTGGPTA